MVLLVSTSVPSNSVDAFTDLASPITVTEMISSYLDRPILPLAVTLPMLLQNVEAEKRAPSNCWSWYGLAELYRTRGKADQASKLEADLAKMWIGDRRQLELSKL